jgi:acyl-homoserine-lactone acylase
MKKQAIARGVQIALVLALSMGQALDAKRVTRPVAPHKVTITRDTYGIAHIYGATDADAVYGMIYTQAQDDFPRIEANYLTNLGRLAEAEGMSAIWQDLRQRLFTSPEQLQADYAKSPAWLRGLMDAWAAGLNAYLADNPQVHPRVIHHFEPWMALSFTEGSIGGDIERIPLSQLEAFYSHRHLAMTAMEKGIAYHEPQGSNGAAIAPSHSASGHALLLINPHTSFFFRSEAQVTSGQGLNAYGAATWGQFFIYQGFNEHAGWMHTSSGIDNVDEFTETLAQTPFGTPKAYRYGETVRPFVVRPVTLSYRLPDGKMARRTFTTFASHHGPIIREEGGKWIAFAMMNKPVAALQQSFLRTKAVDLAGFMKVAELKANSSNNTLFADDKGETAYLHPQFVPIRDAGLDWRAPVDGSNPASDWKGLHSLDSLPQVINPANGWVYNTNNAPWTAAGADSPKADRFPAYMDQVGVNPRGDHAVAVLQANEHFTLDSLREAFYDSRLTAFDRQLPGLFAAAEKAPNAGRDAGIALLKGWDRRFGLNSAATSLAVFWGEALWAKGAAQAKAQRITVWDWMATEASDAQRLAALDEAMARLKADFGDWRVPWGEINRYQRNDGAIAQVFDDAKPSLPVPFASAQWGSLASFGAARAPGTKRYYGTRGNSFVAVVEFGPKVSAKAVSIGGESGDPASPHFADQAELYAKGAFRPVWFYPEDLAAHVEATKEIIRR